MLKEIPEAVGRAESPSDTQYMSREVCCSLGMQGLLLILSCFFRLCCLLFSAPPTAYSFPSTMSKIPTAVPTHEITTCQSWRDLRVLWARGFMLGYSGGLRSGVETPRSHLFAQFGEMVYIGKAPGKPHLPPFRLKEM